MLTTHEEDRQIIQRREAFWMLEVSMRNMKEASDKWSNMKEALALLTAVESDLRKASEDAIAQYDDDLAAYFMDHVTPDVMRYVEAGGRCVLGVPALRDLTSEQLERYMDTDCPYQTNPRARAYFLVEE